MKFFKQFFGAVYHIWFYVVQFLVILLILPFLLGTTGRYGTYPRFFRWARVWGRGVLIGMGLFPVVKRNFKPQKNQTYIFCSNHSSEVDILMNYLLVRSPFMFIGKEELAKIPLFGFFYSKTNILVNRKSIASKRAVLEKAAAKLKEGIGVCIYPEGGIPNPELELAPFKNGAFKLAIENNIPIVPITFPDNKKRFPDTFLGGAPGILRATIHEPLHTNDLSLQQIDQLKGQCFKIIEDELKRYQGE